MSLTAPTDIKILETKDQSIELMEKIEAQLAKLKEYAPDPDDPQTISLKLKINGHYTSGEMKKVETKYRVAGWKTVHFRKEYGDANHKDTYVYFTASVPVMRKA